LRCPEYLGPGGAKARIPLAIDLSLRLTLLDLILRPVGNWALRPLILGLAAVAFLKSGWLRHPAPWLALMALAGARGLIDWPLADNHAYLLAYWCLATALALMTRDAERVLSFNGRLLIGLLFLFACLWKFAGSDNYFDGTFFQVTLLTDARFEGFAKVAGGLEDQTYDELHAFVDQHRDTAPPHPEATVPVPSRFTALAMAATAWNLAINAALAIAFLWPTGPRVGTLRHALLLIYCVITYAVATVDGFGWLLLAMGAAQCTPQQRRTRWAYVLVFVLILLYREIPWADAVFLPLMRDPAASG
jgi:hypothetical protein